LEFALRQRRVAIVPRDTTEAIAIYALLSKALGEEWRVEGGVEEFVKVLFLPAHFQEEDGDVAKLARVDYGNALKGIAKDWKGVSPSLARLVREYRARGGLDDFKQLIAVIRALEPEKSAKALYELAVEVGGGFASEAASKAVEEVSGVIAAGAALAVMGLNPLAIVAGAAAGWTARKIVDKVKKLLDKARDRRTDVAKDVLTLFQLAKSVYPSLCPREGAGELERFEAVVDEVAAKWGMSLDQFKAFLCNIGALATSKVVTEEELEERLRRLEDLALLKASAPTAVYVEAWEWPYVAEVGEGLAVLEGAVKGPYVETKLEEELLKRLEAAVEEARRGDGRVVLLRGPKGVGKSTAAAAALYKLLKGGKVAVTVFDLGAVVDETKTPDFLSEAKRRGFVPVLYLDPTRLEFYSSRTLARPPIARAVDNLAKLVELAKRGGAVALMVLSEDQVETIAQSEGLGGEVKKMILSDVDVIKVGDVVKAELFVKALVEKYSNCSSDMVEGTAKAIVLSFKDGYAVAAVLAADWLKRGGCRGEEVERAVERAKGDVHRFALDYIWHVVLGKDVAVAKWHVPLLLAVGLFGPHPPKLAEAVVRAFGGEPEDAVVRWFSQPLHGTIFEAIKNFVNCVDHSRRNFALCEDNVAKMLIKSIPRELAENEERSTEMLKQKIVTAVSAHLSSLVEDFARAVNGRKLKSLTQGGCRLYWWVLKSKALGMIYVPVEDVYDWLDVLLAVLGIASLRVVLPTLEEFAREWVMIGRLFMTIDRERGLVVVGEPAQALFEYVLAALYTDGGALRSKVAEVFYKVRNRGYLTQMDAWEVVGLLKAVDWENADDEEVKYALRLSHYLFREYRFALPEAVKSSLQRLFKAALSRLDRVAGELAFLYRKYSIEGLDPWALYDKVNGIEKVFVLQGLLRQRKIGRDDLDKIEEKVKELENSDVSLLLRLIVYPRLAVHYAEVGEREKAETYIDRSLKALSRVGPSSETLWHLLSPYYSPLEFSQWTEELPLYVYLNVAIAYRLLGNVQKGSDVVEKVCLVSSSALRERIAVNALKKYQAELRKERSSKEIITEIVCRISSYEYSVPEVFIANTQKINKTDMSLLVPIDVPITVSKSLSLTIESIIRKLLSSDDDELVLAKLYYNKLLNELFYI